MTQTSGHVVVCGSINQDVTVEVTDFPQPGQTILAGDVSTTTGGKGANQAIAAALSGAHVSILGTIGHDAAGKDALATLTRAGVNTSYTVENPTTPTGTAFISVRGDGENTIVVAPGANHLLRAETFHELPLDEHAWVLLSLEIPEVEALKYAARAQQQGAKVALNASPHLAAGLEPGLVDCLIVNEAEIQSLVGPEWSQLENLADLLGVEAVLTTQGAHGVRLDETGQAPQHVDATSVTVRDSTGSGDAFAGVLVASLAAGRNYRQAVETAVIYAGSVAAYPGAAASYPPAFAAVHNTSQHVEEPDYDR